LGVELRLLVQIQDDNDHTPQFTRTEYEVEVNEAAVVPLPLIQVTATDRDSGDYGLVTYEGVYGLLRDK
jgi:hypothetical protein